MTTARRVAVSLVPPLVASVLARSSEQLAGAAAGLPVWSAGDFAKWDSSHYIGIASEGYIAYPCAVYEYLPDGWCGNAGWLPGYPLLLRALQAVGFSPEWGGVLLSELFFYLALWIIWNRFARARLDANGLLLLGLAAFFPGNVYFHAVFPMSLSVLLSLVLLELVVERRPLPSAVVGVVAGATYPSGVLLSVFGGVRALIDLATGSKSRSARLTTLVALAAPPVGLLMVVLWQLAVTGVWGAFFKVQSNNAFFGSTPFSTLLTPVALLLDVGAWSHISRLAASKAIQTGAVTVFSLLTLGAVALEWRRQGFLGWSVRRERELLLCALLLVYGFLPHYPANPTHSFYRGESLLMPSVILAQKLPVAVRVVFLVVFVEISMRIAVLFFEGRLV